LKNVLVANLTGEIFYLNAISTKPIIDISSTVQQVYNVSGDNRLGILQLNYDEPALKNKVWKKLPYVVMKRGLDNPYGNFQVLPYFKESKNPTYFADPGGDSTNVKNGDSYVTSMRYTSSIYYNFRLRERSTKSGTWKIILGSLEVVAGVVAIVVGLAGSIFTGGASVALVGLGISAIGAGVSTISSGVELNNLVDKMYEALCFYSHAAFEHGNRYLNGFDVDGECLEKARQAIAEYKIYKNGVI